MILCGYNTDIGGGGVGLVGVFPHPEGHRIAVGEGRAGQE